MEQIVDITSRLLTSTLGVALDAAPWLLFGLLFAGVIRAWLPERAVAKWLGDGRASVVRAAVIGTPLPLCSCGVVPAAMGLRRAGASKPATVSFLVATPENGADSIALSWALLGPVMAVARVVSALACAIGAGLLALTFDRGAHPAREPKSDDAGSCCSAATPCCSEGSTEKRPQARARGLSPSCCSSTAPAEPSATERLGEGLHFALTSLLDDLAKWLVIGLVVSGAVIAFVPDGALASWGSGPLAMVLMALVGVPMYVCATAATPVAASLILAGVSPGAALVFLLAGPATNLGTVGIVRRELGTGALVAYLAGVVALAIGCGLGLEWVLSTAGWSVIPTAGAGGGHVFPASVSAGALCVLIVFGFGPLRRLAFRVAGMPG